MLFTQAAEQRAYERMMTAMPNFSPRGHGVYYFRASPTWEDYSCDVCTYQLRNKCQLDHCCMTERIRVGMIPMNEVLRELGYAQQNPKPVKASIQKFFQENLAEYEQRWCFKVRQFQIPIFLEHTDAMWQIRFDDVIANALILGSLREMEAELTEQQKEKLLPYTQGEIKLEYLTSLVSYYLANKPEDSDWVVLPSTNFNCYFGSTVFSKKVLREITGKVIQRSDTSYGSGRYRVLEEFL